jgi:exodeoxyribonuclease VIII
MIVHGKPEAEYHADFSSLSSTGAKTLLRSPRQYRYQWDHPKQISAGPLGTLTHALVLGTPHNFTIKDWDARTKEGKLKAARIAAEGGEVIDRSDWELAHDMATAVARHPEAGKLFTHGEAEVSVYAEDPSTGVAKRGRIDWWREDSRIVDLKTAQDASPRGFARAVANYRYHLQDAWYEDLARLNGRPASEFVFVAVEKDPPHLIGVYRLPREALMAGNVLVDRACQVYRDCIEAEEQFGPDAWPEWGRPGEPVETLALPRWAYAEVEDSAWL